jgi:hypothetical protein
VIESRLPDSVSMSISPFPDDYLVSTVSLPFKEAAAVIEAEHRCCPFLRFVLIVEPGDGSLFLEVTGPEGTEDFLSMLVGSNSPRSSQNL